MEQVAAFQFTEYPPDGRGSMEIDFETKLLTYDRRGGFVLPLVSDDGELQEDLVQIWMRRMESLGGPTLLERRPSKPKDGDQEDNDDPDGPNSALAKPSFASDRRIIRLIIARIFADLLTAKFLEKQG